MVITSQTYTLANDEKNNKSITYIDEQGVEKVIENDIIFMKNGSYWKVEKIYIIYQK